MISLIHSQNRRDRIPIDRNSVLIRVKIDRMVDYEKELILCYWNRQLDNPESYNTIVMKLVAKTKEAYFYEAIIKTDYPTSYIKYLFLLKGNSEEMYIDYYGSRKQFNTKYAYEYIYTNTFDIYSKVNWTQRAVFYQIFPERFYNGDQSNNPKNVVDWKATPTRDNFMGGDIKGIQQKLDYLADLGISALYINPIFHAKSNHKYDTIDYFTIDPMFGTNEEFKQFVIECHNKNIKVVLDGVFNHCGYEFPLFQEALMDKESEYRKWFYFDDIQLNEYEKLDYECVGYYKFMPKFNYSTQEVRDYFLSVGKYWINEYDIDGWRLDVADEVDYTFWYEFRKAIKSVKPDSFILAETWSEKTDMLMGDQMDSVMNYLFRDAVIEYVADDAISTEEFDERLTRITCIYPSNIGGQLFNLLGSHDTERFYTATKDDIKKHKLGMVLLLMFKGIPCLYYGDEIPLVGENDPGCRSTMIWDNEETELKIYIKRLLYIRNNYEAIQKGRFVANICDDHKKCYGFIRFCDNESIYIIINSSNSKQELKVPMISADFTVVELISGKEEATLDIKSFDKHLYYNSKINNYKRLIKTSVEANSAQIYVARS